MNDLKINYAETISVGNQVTSKGADFTDLLNRIKTVNNELKTYWEGSDASKYSTAVETQAETMQKLATTMTEIGDFLVKVGNAYQEACENNASGIN